MATKKNDAQKAMIELPGIDIGLLQVNIVGDSALIVHKWQEKAKKEMLEKQDHR